MTTPALDASEYGLPSPETKDEHGRLEIQHRLWLNSLKALFTAPVSEPISHVLDIGCGPGLWTRDMALKHPSARIYGLDLNPPSSISMPSNVSFHKGNAEDAAILNSVKPAEAAGFDFIFGRCLTLGIHDWEAHLSRCHAVLRPGGWLESQETTIRFLNVDFPNATAADSPFERWNQRLHDGARALGFDPELATPGRVQDAFKAAGFVNYAENAEIWWPFGGSEQYPWEKEEDRLAAEYAQPDFMAFMRGVTEKVLPAVEGMTLEDARALTSEAMREVDGPEARRFWVRFAVRIAQKAQG